MPSPSNATPLPLRCVASHCLCVALRVAIPCLCVALRCFAHAPQIKPAPFRCHSILCIPVAWARPCNARASPITAFAVPNIARALLGHPLPSPCFSPLSRRCALPRRAIAERCPALPPLCLPPQCHRFPALRPAFARLCSSTPLRRPPLPRIAFALQCEPAPLRLIAACRIADAFLINPSPDRAAFGHASPSPCVPWHFITGAHPALRFPSAGLSFPSPGQRFASLRLCCTGPLGAIHCPRISVLSVPLPMQCHAKQRQRISSLRLALPVLRSSRPSIASAPPGRAVTALWPPARTGRNACTSQRCFCGSPSAS